MGADTGRVARDDISREYFYHGLPKPETLQEKRMEKETGTLVLCRRLLLD